MNQPLRHVVCHMDYRNFFVPGCKGLVGKKWIVNDPGLWHRLLRIVKLILSFNFVAVRVLIQVGTPHVQSYISTRVFFEQDRTKDSRWSTIFTTRPHEGWPDVPHLMVILLLSPQIWLVDVEVASSPFLGLTHCFLDLLVIGLIWFLSSGVDIIQDDICLGDTHAITVSVFICSRSEFRLNMCLAIDLEISDIFSHDSVNYLSLIDRFDCCEFNLWLKVWCAHYFLLLVVHHDVLL